MIRTRIGLILAPKFEQNLHSETETWLTLAVVSLNLNIVSKQLLNKKLLINLNLTAYLIEKVPNL